MNTVRLYKVYDRNNELRQILIPQKYNCHAISYNELCGGCDDCLLRIYEENEFKIVNEIWPEKEADFIRDFFDTKYSMNKCQKFVNYCKYYHLQLKRKFINHV